MTCSFSWSLFLVCSSLRNCLNFVWNNYSYCVSLSAFNVQLVIFIEGPYCVLL